MVILQLQVDDSKKRIYVLEMISMGRDRRMRVFLRQISNKPKEFEKHRFVITDAASSFGVSISWQP